MAAKLPDAENIGEFARTFDGYARQLRELAQAKGERDKNCRKCANANFGNPMQAIEFNPRHRGAHQHLGETYLSVGELAKAEAQLTALEAICLLPCEEYGDLKRAIAMYKQRSR